MNPLDTQRLFLDCPYPVTQDGNEYTFKTEHDIVYSVDFKEEQTFSPIPAYWFDLTNLSHKPSSNGYLRTYLYILVVVNCLPN